MNLDLNSKTAQLYRWFYEREVWDMPNNLCTYFWQVVVMVIFFIPALIIWLPWFIVRVVSYEWEPRWTISIILWFCSVIVFAVGAAVSYPLFNYPEDSFMYAVALMGLGFGGIGLGALCIWGVNRLRNSTTKSTLVGSYIKSRAKSICPIIKWK